MAKKFMYVCLGILALAIAYHMAVQVQVAKSQEGERAVLMTAGVGSDINRWAFVMTDQGNIYRTSSGSTWELWGTWPGDPPALSQSTTWGQIKAEFGE